LIRILTKLVNGHHAKHVSSLAMDRRSPNPIGGHGFADAVAI
jgi:hypothetical protein